MINSCLANYPRLYTCIYTVIRTSCLHLRLTNVFWSITFKTVAPQNVSDGRLLLKYLNMNEPMASLFITSKGEINSSLKRTSMYKFRKSNDPYNFLL